MKAMEIIIMICGIIGTAYTVLMAYKAIFTIIGVFSYRKFPKAKKEHKYGICVAARNEDKVIGNLLDSIANSDYNLEQITVFVVADNCTDDTAKVAREFQKNGLKVVVYEHNNPDERTKGFALRYLFDRIEEDYGRAFFEGYFIFDADNVIRRNYLTKMNEAFDAGNKIITSYRNSKNMNQNWISFSYAMHWMRTCLTENRAKGVLNQACRIQGTGFLFSNELVKDGWNYTTLTEDRSFCTDAVVQGYRITYCDEAVFYDEQPYKLRVALRQRLRWSKGHLQSAVENCPKLLRNMFKKDKCFTTTYDCFFLNFPRHIESACRKCVVQVLEVIMAILGGTALAYFFNIHLGINLKIFNFQIFSFELLNLFAEYTAQGVLFGWLLGKIGSWFGSMFIELLVLIVYRKKMEKAVGFGGVMRRIFHVFMFPFFDVIGKWTTYIAVFKKIEWKPIPHDTVMDMSQLQDTEDAPAAEAVVTEPQSDNENA